MKNIGVKGRLCRVVLKKKIIIEVQNDYQYSNSYICLLMQLNWNIIETFLLKDDSLIHQLSKIVNDYIVRNYIILLEIFDENNLFVNAFREIIYIYYFLIEKYEEKKLAIEIIITTYYVLNEKIETLTNDMTEQMFIDNYISQEYKENIICIIKETSESLSDLYTDRKKLMRNKFNLIDKTLEFISEYRNQIYSNMFFIDDNNEARKKVFISYTHKDKAVVYSVKNCFKLSKLKIWFDEDNILPAQKISEEIKNGIENSDYFLVFDSENSRDSEYVKLEIDYATKCFEKFGRPKIIPILIGVDKPINEEITNTKGITFTNIDETAAKVCKAIDSRYIEINTFEFNALIKLVNEFRDAVDYTWADPNMDLGEGDFEMYEMLEHTINSKWIMCIDEIDISFIRKSNNKIEYDYEFYNSDRVTCIGAFKINIILKILDKIIENCSEDIYKEYISYIYKV
ncbi:toll/interleukin-1 receptor domain-containing protein [Clostridium beijerinckii]|uniref:toll/interleukin-1 receptor domain-containing protein n=1 Tax=Clostridium beijerinckii TaxID=1520 RepID=UPI00098C5AC3|nr:toll/interleukin-1 receptor domain-containing protein [Clostridium beijerinckii]NRT77628.1 hypothetical protein [Clostridium beijerinckii]OOM50470.1 TIR domain protein [Clostridium beijerinckii]